MCTSFKGELLNALHQFGSPTIVSRVSLTAPTVDSFKGALYLATGTQGAATTAYSATNELAATGNYTAGGTAVTNATAPSTSGTSAIWTPSASLSWANLTSSGSFDCVTLYNATQGNRSVSVHTFSAQSVSAATFTLTMPTNAVGTALIQIT